MRRLLLAVAIGQITATALAAQGRTSLEQQLDPHSLAAVRAIIDSARFDSIPSQALEDKVLEGVAKHVPPARIVAAVRQFAAELRDARALLRAGAPGATLVDGEIVAAADARRRGVPPAEVSALRGHVSPKASLLVALTVLGDLVQRGVPAGQARDVIEQLIAAGVSSQQLAEIPARMDVGLRVGAPPLDALRSALPVPVRPVSPPRGTPPKPSPSENNLL
jgi:hypothetical protein